MWKASILPFLLLLMPRLCVCQWDLIVLGDADFEIQADVALIEAEHTVATKAVLTVQEFFDMTKTYNKAILTGHATSKGLTTSGPKRYLTYPELIFKTMKEGYEKVIIISCSAPEDIIGTLFPGYYDHVEYLRAWKPLAVRDIHKHVIANEQQYLPVVPRPWQIKIRRKFHLDRFVLLCVR